MKYLIATTLFFAPAYAIRFPIFGLSTNILMLWILVFWTIFGIYIFQTRRFKVLQNFLISLDKKLLILVVLFFLSGLLSLISHGADQHKLGEFIALIMQPISIFFLAKYIFNEQPASRHFFLTSCYMLLAAMGILALTQYFTLFSLPSIYWGNSEEPKRAVALFSHPNFYALFIAPLLALLLPDFGLKILNFKKNIIWITLWLLGVIGLLLSLSRAGWLGLAAAIGVYVIVEVNKKFYKIIFAVVVMAALVVVATPNFRYRLILPFYGEKSAVSRFSLWKTGWKGISESPITGLGLTGFSNNWERLNIDQGLTDTHNFPHNIFLDAWVELGLLGLISFIGIIIWGLWRGFSNKHEPLLFGTALFIVCFLIQGQIDNPYFKNDLALVFWLMISLIT